MSISFACPNCSKSYRVGDQLGGKRVKCKGCGQPVEIPPAVEGDIPLTPDPIDELAPAPVTTTTRIVYVEAAEDPSAMAAMLEKMPPWARKGLAILDRFRPR